MFAYSPIRALLLVLTLAVPNIAAAAPFTDVYFFGASQSDTGNNGPIDVAPGLPSSFGYDPDRWTNAGGTMWSEGLAAGLGFSGASVASSDGGNNYAVGGQRADEVPGQISALSLDVGGALDSTALYAIWSGGNDFLQGQTAASTVIDVTDAIMSLASLGAEQFLVLNMADFSYSPGGGPLGAAAPIPPGADVWANDFNSGLTSALATLTGVTVYEYDVASLLNGIFADPVGNGFAAGLSLCADDVDCINGIDTEDFVFMDHVHLMSGPGDLIAAGALSAVPEPSTAMLLSLGLGLLAARGQVQVVAR